MVSIGVSGPEILDTRARKHAQQTVKAALGRIGRSEAVEKFLRRYGNVETKAAYAVALAQYFQWLKDNKKVRLSLHFSQLCRLRR